MKKVVYFWIVLIYACGSQELEIGMLPTYKNSLGNIVLIDTFKNELKLDTASFITEAEFHPMFIGKRVDSIILNYNSRKIEQRHFEWTINKMPDSNDLNVYIDTTKIIGSSIKTITALRKRLDNGLDWKTIAVEERGEIKSYPVIIENTSRDTLTIGYGEYIPLILEAVDSLGEWKPIQEPYTYFCGTGLTHIYIQPNQSLITSCKLYRGEYLTKMRLAFSFHKAIYSNEFYGQMNYKQFDKSPNMY